MMTQGSMNVVMEEIVEYNDVKEAAGKEVVSDSVKGGKLLCNDDDRVLPDSVDEFPPVYCETLKEKLATKTPDAFSFSNMLDKTDSKMV
ncbi:hypothetical protein Tco_0817107 [Tanacetum coccineum]